MKVHVLGHWGAYPEAGEATTGLLVEDGGTRILIDCGSGVLAQLFRICSLDQLSAVVISHHHHDHAADLGVFSYALLLARLTGQRHASLPMYMLEGPVDRMEDFRREPGADVHILQPETVVNIGGIQVSFATTTHPVPCLAIRLEKAGHIFVFSADTAFSDSVIELAREATMFLCESSLYEGQEETAEQVGHLTAPQAGKMAAAAQVERLVLTHFPHYGNHDDLLKQAGQTFAGQIELARMGTVLEI